MIRIQIVERGDSDLESELRRTPLEHFRVTPRGLQGQVRGRFAQQWCEVEIRWSRLADHHVLVGTIDRTPQATDDNGKEELFLGAFVNRLCARFAPFIHSISIQFEGSRVANAE